MERANKWIHRCFLIIFLAITLIVFVNLPAFNLLTVSEKENLIPERKPVVPLEPEYFDTFKFKVLFQLYINTDNQISWLYYQKLNLLDNPATSVIKYSPKHSIQGEIKFYNNQLWLAVFDRKVAKFLIIYIDNGFDGWVHRNQDKLYDRVAMMSPQGDVLYVNSEISYTDRGIGHQFDVSPTRSVTITVEDYRQYLNMTLGQIKSRNKGQRFLKDL